MLTLTWQLPLLGGGFPKDIQHKMWSWSFTTVDDNSTVPGGLGNLSENQDALLAGLGVGLPMSQAYAGYFGGSLEGRWML